MATKSSFFLAVLLIANPFMLLIFQNCSPTARNERTIASSETQPSNIENEVIIQVDKNLKIK